MLHGTSDKKLIEKLVIDNAVRNFAQGILVEAVDATYAMGYIDDLFQTIRGFLTSRNLSKGPVDFLKTFAKKAMKHWFKHATQNDLLHAKYMSQSGQVLKEIFALISSRYQKVSRN